MHWWLPAKASTFTGPIDGLFLAILIITGIAFRAGRGRIDLVRRAVSAASRPEGRFTRTEPRAPR